MFVYVHDTKGKQFYLSFQAEHIVRDKYVAIPTNLSIKILGAFCISMGLPVIVFRQMVLDFSYSREQNGWKRECLLVFSPSAGRNGK